MSEDERAVRIELPSCRAADQPSCQDNDVLDAARDCCMNLLRRSRFEDGKMPCTS